MLERRIHENALLNTAPIPELYRENFSTPVTRPGADIPVHQGAEIVAVSVTPQEAVGVTDKRSRVKAVFERTKNKILTTKDADKADKPDDTAVPAKNRWKKAGVRVAGAVLAVSALAGCNDSYTITNNITVPSRTPTSEHQGHDNRSREASHHGDSDGENSQDYETSSANDNSSSHNESSSNNGHSESGGSSNSGSGSGSSGNSESCYEGSTSFTVTASQNGVEDTGITNICPGSDVEIHRTGGSIRYNGANYKDGGGCNETSFAHQGEVYAVLGGQTEPIGDGGHFTANSTNSGGNLSMGSGIAPNCAECAEGGVDEQITVHHH